MSSYYLKYNIDNNLIRKILTTHNKKKINFFLDIQSICKGFYSEQTVFYETNYYIENKTYSNQLILELKNFMNSLYSNFKSYDPYFVLFYDDSINIQNSKIMSSYKEDRHNAELDENRTQCYTSKEMQKNIKEYYFNEIPKHFVKNNLSDVYYLPDLETDFIPHYCIMNNLYDSREDDILNIIFSVDKDLLQTCKFNNTVQYTNCYFPSAEQGKRVVSKLYDRHNAVSYIYKKYSKNILKAEHIPLILAISGDKSDSIPGIESGVGISKTIRLIENFNLPVNYWEIEKNINIMPKVIQRNLDALKRNMSLIDFEMQISRIKSKIVPITV